MKPLVRPSSRYRTASVLPGTTEEGRRFRLDTADRLLTEGMAAYADETLPKMIAPYNVQTQTAVAAHVRAMMAAAAPAGAATALRGRAERRDYRQLLTEVSVPTLVVVGLNDEFTRSPTPRP